MTHSSFSEVEVMHSLSYFFFSASEHWRLLQLSLRQLLFDYKSGHGTSKNVCDQDVLGGLHSQASTKSEIAMTM